MSERCRTGLRLGAVGLMLLVLTVPVVADTQPAVKGQRIFFTGHSFHFFVPPILADLAKGAGIKDQEQLGLSAIGGSRVIQHWNVPAEKNKAKEALQAGKVDVLTL